jgi:hypothetical protein
MPGITFGDVPGHEFHGNQWTAGQAMGAATAANVAAHDVTDSSGRNAGRYASITALGKTAKAIKSGSVKDHVVAQTAHEEAARTHGFYSNEHKGQDLIYQNRSDFMHRQAEINHKSVAAWHEQQASALYNRPLANLGRLADRKTAATKPSKFGRNVIVVKG